MTQQALPIVPGPSLDDIAQAIWGFLARNLGGAEIDDLVGVVSSGLNDPAIDRGVCHRAFAQLRDYGQVDKGRSFITVLIGGRTIYALANRPEQVIAYHFRRARAEVTRQKRDEKNATAALEQFPDDRDLQRLARLRRRMREDAEELRDELREMLNGAV